MNVLSLFDGMSCGQIALERVGIKVDNYFASEIDKYAIKVAKHNYPNTQHIGDVTKVKAEDLPDIDLLIGGSPCQGFSFAGKGLNFDDPRSKLFFEFVRLLEECKPKYFLLENVKMKKEYQDIISGYLGVEPVLINSALVSAHNRPRQYWHNIPNFEMPEDRNIKLEDILIKQHNSIVVDKTVKPSVADNVIRNYWDICTSDKDFFTMKVKSGFSDNKVGLKKSPCLRAGNSSTYVKDGSCVRKMTPLEWERLQTVPDKVFYAIIDLKELLWLDQAKNFVNAVEKNHKLLKLVLSAEKKELKEYVNTAMQSMSANHQSIKHIAQKSVDIQTQKQIKECTSYKQIELSTNVNSAKNCVLYQNQDIEGDFAVVSVFVNLTEGQITHNGKAESLLKDSSFHNQRNGESVQKLYLKEIMELVENVDSGTEKMKEKNFMYTMSYHLNMKNTERILATLYYFARNVTDGHIVPKIKIENLYLSLTDGYTSAVSDSQRYKMIGNGWTVDVIAHIFKGLK